jgi:HK97 gp10 family phage protein
MPGFIYSVDASKALEKIDRVRNGLSRLVEEKMEAVGEAIKAHAQAIAPKRTGYMASTIYSKYNRAEMTLDTGATADYSSFVEFGTCKMAAQSFIRPAVDAHMDELGDNVHWAMIMLFEGKGE